MSKLQMKWAGVVALTAFALFMLYPTTDWYTKDAAQRDRLEASRLRPKHLLNLGLDLKGGTHLLMELEVEKLPPGSDMMEALGRAMEIIRNRVDQLGIAEPLITRQGERWIVVQLPGIKNSQMAKEVVGQTALLEFRMVDSSQGAQQASQKIYELGDPFATGTISTAAAALLPKDTRLFRGRESSYYILRDTVPVTGAQLDSARVETGGDGLPIVAFKFKPDGAKVFGDLTSANVGQNMAIVLDGVVQSAPVIRSPIRGGSGIIEGNFTMEEARKLSIVLRAGALPAPLRIIEERTVGATLGDDSIRQGLTACWVGCLIVFIFMIVYYKVGGIFADVAMVLNVIFTMALMAYFGATLTLPGIAGLALTVGMAIDANVLILERMREELRLGKPMRIAMDAGYDKAFSAILDSNVTTLVAALFLFQFGTGPVKGFAVTLTLGLLCSMFTAIVATRLMFQGYLATGVVQKLSI
ncbi:MAG: protein-export membrane protein SecD [Elusimicrobia bacterium GWA2_69_24]|nr:MAG: protein-export membrane protein SecD [Elusimicrobia bacterium GWA2_69_24]HBL19113.1 protein translocase subunit SecD [Elusimicrobiota bacterium]